MPDIEGYWYSGWSLKRFRAADIVLRYLSLREADKSTRTSCVTDQCVIGVTVIQRNLGLVENLFGDVFTERWKTERDQDEPLFGLSSDMASLFKLKAYLLTIADRTFMTESG